MKGMPEQIQAVDAILRRLESQLLVVTDVVTPWIRGGRADDVVERSSIDDKVIELYCDYITASMRVISNWILYQSIPSLEPQNWKLTLEPIERLKVSSQAAADLAAQVLKIRQDLEGWLSETAIDPCRFVHAPTDYYRWQIVKALAGLVSIFDDHDTFDTSHNEPSWARVRQGLGHE